MEDSTSQSRIALLAAYGIMDTPEEQAFDDITQIAATICQTEISLVSLLDDKRQWFKSHHGIDACQTPIEQAFCAHAIRACDLLIVEDAQQDERFRHNPLVTGEPFIRFYAGSPLVTPQGVAIGTLCVIDREPKQLDNAQKEMLAALGRQVVDQLELRLYVQKLTAALVEKDAALKEVQELRAILPICSYCLKIRDDGDFWHQVDHYLQHHAGIEFSHGICPECLEGEKSKAREE